MPLTCSSARPVLPAALTVGLALGAVLAAGVSVAGPAAALEDPRRPTATVTHGPSCGPAVVRIQVTNGTEPHRVALVFDGVAEQDVADLVPGEQVELTSEDVDWGVTVDVSVTVADPDGTVERPLQFDTYTRPSEEDCAAVMPSPTPAPVQSASPVPSTPVPSTSVPPASTPAPVPSAPQVPPASPVPSTATPPPPAPAPAPVPSTVPSSPELPPELPSPTTSSGTPSSTPEPRSSGPRSSTTSAPSDTGAEPDVGSGSPSRPSGPAGSAPTTSVSPGGVVTVRASGFTPGEPVSVSMADGAELLSTVTAAADGSVEAVVQIPRGAALGAATLEFVGGESAAIAGLDLQVAARSTPVTEPAGSPVVFAAGLVLLAGAGSLALVGARRSRGGRREGRR